MLIAAGIWRPTVNGPLRFFGCGYIDPLACDARSGRHPGQRYFSPLTTHNINPLTHKLTHTFALRRAGIAPMLRVIARRLSDRLPAIAPAQSLARRWLAAGSGDPPQQDPPPPPQPPGWRDEGEAGTSGSTEDAETTLLRYMNALIKFRGGPISFHEYMQVIRIALRLGEARHCVRGSDAHTPLPYLDKDMHE